MAKVNRIFAELLSPARGRRRQTVQAKFYLSAEIASHAPACELPAHRNVDDALCGKLVPTFPKPRMVLRCGWPARGRNLRSLVGPLGTGCHEGAAAYKGA